MKKKLVFLYHKIILLLRIPYFLINKSYVPTSNTIASNVSLKLCKIGKYNYIASRTTLYNVEIGNYCCLGPNIHIGGMQHSYWWYSMSPLLSEECKAPNKTFIGNDVWLGAGCIIKQGVKIGNGAVVGANSFVNKDVEPFSIVVGSPAKLLKYRFNEDIQDAITNSGYWNKKPKEARSILNCLTIKEI